MRGKLGRVGSAVVGNTERFEGNEHAREEGSMRYQHLGLNYFTASVAALQGPS